MTTVHDRPDPTLAGRELRYAVAVALHEAQRTLTLDELATILADRGVIPPGDARKAISDALRWELHRGRARRVGRGRYRSRGLARSTVSWMREQVRCALNEQAELSARSATPCRPG